MTSEKGDAELNVSTKKTGMNDEMNAVRSDAASLFVTLFARIKENSTMNAEKMLGIIFAVVSNGMKRLKNASM
jgi:hypothetical protein